ncbi:MAG: AAA family ATPase [Propionibacteriaceae bacterium]|jgi:hypothetical protein|nr:AAA family ATPase [Propionibacteriaceae bacterium]
MSKSKYQQACDKLDSEGFTCYSSNDAEANYQCPAHDDESGSLTVIKARKDVRLFCVAGCSEQAIRQALGIDARDAWDNTTSSVCDTCYVSDTVTQADSDEPETYDWRKHIKSGDWLDAQKLPPLQYMVPGLIPEGLLVLAGAPKIGKSWMVLDLALAVARGGRALGSIDVEQRPVLYLALEDGDRRLQDRCWKLLEGAPIPAAFQYLLSVPQIEAGSVINGWLTEQPRGLVIVDTLAKVRPSARQGEKEYDRDYRYGTYLQGILSHHSGATVLLVHHTRKTDGGADWMNETLGSQGINGSVDATLILSRRRNDGQGTLKVTGRDVGEGEYSVSFTDGVWRLVGDTLKNAADAARQQAQTGRLGGPMKDILELVNAHPDGVTAAQIEQRLDLAPNTVRQYLKRGTDEERIVRLSRGLYGPVPEMLPTVTVSLTSQLSQPPDEPGAPEDEPGDMPTPIPPPEVDRQRATMNMTEPDWDEPPEGDFF